MFLGVNTHFAQGWNIGLLDTALADGIANIRDAQYWTAIEQTPGVYSFPTQFTQYMAKAAADNVNVSLTLDWGNPLYDGGYSPYTDAGRQAFANYCVAVLDKYAGQVKQVEIWNEYNGTWATGPALADRAGYYTLMLKAAYAAIKASHPEVTVIGGATAGVPLPYLDQLFKDGALSAMDAVSVHSYTNPAGGIDNTLAQLTQSMLQYGVAKPIYVTEFGEANADPGYLIKSVAMLSAAHVAGAYWYPLEDYSNFPTEGLLTTTGVAKPAMKAYETIQTILASHADAARQAASDPQVYDYRFGNDVQIIWGNGETLTITGAHTTLDATGAVIKDPWALGSSPIIVEGSGAVVTFGASAFISDSVLDYGSPDWSYFSLDAKGKVDALTPLTDVWGTHLRDPTVPWLTVTALGVHPGLHGTSPILVVERYTSPLSATVNLNGSWTVGAGGNGVDVIIVQNGTTIWQSYVTTHTDLKNLAVTLHAGDHLDFELGPHGDLNFDYTAFDMTITALPPPPPAPAAFTLAASATSGAHSIVGKSGTTSLTADGANNHLDGLGIVHQLFGTTTGDDVFVVHNDQDTVTIGATHGIDTVESWANGQGAAGSYILPANAQNLTLKGNYSHVAVGNALNNLIVCSDAGDTVKGSGGNDITVAGKGADTMSAGTGHDMFVFGNSASHNADIKGFKLGVDILDLRPLMTSLGYAGHDPIADHVLALAADGHGGTTVTLLAGGAHHTLVTIESILPSAIHMGTDFLFHA